MPAVSMVRQLCGLREAGKRDVERLRLFVENHRLEMPRTMLRYAIEKFSPEERKHLMRKG